MQVAVVLYDFVEPIEVAIIGTLSMAKRLSPNLSYFTVSEAGGVVQLQNGLRVATDFSFNHAPSADVVIVTGGPGWRAQSTNPRMLAFLQARNTPETCIASVCTGALILAAAGLLAGKRATTKVPVVAPELCPLDTLSQSFPDTNAVPALVVDEGNVVTGGGVSLCIDLTLYLLARFLGQDIAEETARIMEYGAASAANQARLPILQSQATI
jgi:transcriptional regulator GlxA family with amidase domain